MELPDGKNGTMHSMKKHLFNIDFFRIYLAVGIVLLHLLFIGFGPNFGHTTEFKIVSAYIGKLRYGVDIFFIISGFFIVYTRLYQYNFLEIFLKRALRLWPVMTFCIVAAFLFSLCDLCKFYPLQNLYSLLFINGIRIANHVNGEYPGLGNIHSSWFLSVLMFVTLFYCSLLKFNKERFVAIALPICVMSLYQASYGIHTLFCDGVLRGLGSIGVGCLIGVFYESVTVKEKYKKIFRSILISHNISTKLFITLTQGLLITVLTLALFADRHNRFVMTDFIVIFSFIFILLLINQDFISQMLNHKVSSYLGRYAFSIYLTHCITVEVLRNSLVNQQYYTSFCEFVLRIAHLNNLQTFMLFYLLNAALCVLVGIVTYHLIESKIKIQLTKHLSKNIIVNS